MAFGISYSMILGLYIWLLRVCIYTQQDDIIIREIDDDPWVRARHFFAQLFLIQRCDQSFYTFSLFSKFILVFILFLPIPFLSLYTVLPSFSLLSIYSSFWSPSPSPSLSPSFSFSIKLLPLSSSLKDWHCKIGDWRSRRICNRSFH